MSLLEGNIEPAVAVPIFSQKRVPLLATWYMEPNRETEQGSYYEEQSCSSEVRYPDEDADRGAVVTQWLREAESIGEKGEATGVRIWFEKRIWRTPDQYDNKDSEGVARFATKKILMQGAFLKHDSTRWGSRPVKEFWWMELDLVEGDEDMDNDQRETVPPDWTVGEYEKM